MKFAFDLISDLHIDSWPSLNLDMIATSPFCVVAGDVGRDRNSVLEFIEDLSQHYQAVFYIDGNDEHRYYYHDMPDSYKTLSDSLMEMPDVVFLQNNVVVIDGVAIVGSNGWWDYSFDPYFGDADQSSRWMSERYHISLGQAEYARSLAMTDAKYLTSTIHRLQTHNDVKKIVLVTHTVPRPDLIEHDPQLVNTHGFNCMGNSLLQDVFLNDTEGKISTWAFGHYHGDIDQTIDRVRYVNNCRGKSGDFWCKTVFYPKRIEVDV